MAQVLLLIRSFVILLNKRYNDVGTESPKGGGRDIIHRLQTNNFFHELDIDICIQMGNTIWLYQKLWWKDEKPRIYIHTWKSPSVERWNIFAVWPKWCPQGSTLSMDALPWCPEWGESLSSFESSSAARLIGHNKVSMKSCSGARLQKFDPVIFRPINFIRELICHREYYGRWKQLQSMGEHQIRFNHTHTHKSGVLFIGEIFWAWMHARWLSRVFLMKQTRRSKERTWDYHTHTAVCFNATLHLCGADSEFDFYSWRFNLYVVQIVNLIFTLGVLICMWCR